MRIARVHQRAIAAIDMNSCLAGTPKDVLATTFGMTEETIAKMLEKCGFVLRGTEFQSGAG